MKRVGDSIDELEEREGMDMTPARKSRLKF